MSRELIAALMLSLVPLFALLAFLSVRRRRSQQEKLLSAPNAAFSSDGVECLYVSTVFTDAPLERIWAHGLGSRGDAKISFKNGSVSIWRKGEAGFSFNLEELDRARATIDKGVESKGLVGLLWTSNEKSLTTQVRFRSSESQKKFLDMCQQPSGAK
ncbi:MAG: hypothetical protein RIQ37_137 [Actinomycetota bacterium]